MRYIPVFTKKVKGESLLMDTMQWGVQYFGNLVINGRFEELTEKRLFKDIVHNQRCVVIFDGYYEWK